MWRRCKAPVGKVERGERGGGVGGRQGFTVLWNVTLVREEEDLVGAGALLASFLGPLLKIFSNRLGKTKVAVTRKERFGHAHMV